MMGKWLNVPILDLQAAGWCHLWWATPQKSSRQGVVGAGLTPHRWHPPSSPSLTSPHWASSSATPPISRPIYQFSFLTC